MMGQHFCIFINDLKLGLAEATVYRRLGTLEWANSVPKYKDSDGTYMLISPKLFYKYEPSENEIKSLNNTYKSLMKKGYINVVFNDNLAKIYYAKNE